MRKKRASKSVVYKGHLHLFWALLDSPEFRSLSGSALRLLIAIGRQYNGYNNGDLCASMSKMRDWGFVSNETLSRAKNELIEKELIMQTRQGGLQMGPNLYGLTWQPIDECKRRLDISPTTKPAKRF